MIIQLDVRTRVIAVVCSICMHNADGSGMQYDNPNICMYKIGSRAKALSRLVFVQWYAAGQNKYLYH